MRMFGLVSLALSVFLAPVYAQDTVESIERTAVAQWEQIGSMSGAFDLSASFKLSPEQTMPMNVTGGGTVHYVKSGAAPRYKAYAWAGFSPTTQVLQAQALFDGSKGYYEALAPLFGLNESGQADTDEIVPPGGKLLFAALHTHLTNLSVCPPENVAGADCFVLQGTPKAPGDVPIAKVTLWIAKGTGILCKLMATDATKTQSLVAVLRELKVNPAIGDGAFQFVSLAAPVVAPAAPAAPAAPQK